MSAKIIHVSTRIEGLKVFQPSQFNDHRGCNFEAFNEEVYSSLNGAKLNFPVDSYARSCKNVIRGLHGDTINQKLVEVVYGNAFFVIIDMRSGNILPENVETFLLSDASKIQVLVPPGCVNGHCVTSDTCLFHYRLSHGFTKQEDQLSVKWNDDRHGILWPFIPPAIMSERDK